MSEWTVRFAFLLAGLALGLGVRAWLEMLCDGCGVSPADSSDEDQEDQQDVHPARDDDQQYVNVRADRW